jgi:phospholipase D1/2
MELIAKEGVNPHEYSSCLNTAKLITVTFFNLRSFDRISLTNEILHQQYSSGIDSVKADVALSLELQGMDSFSGNTVSFSKSASGDALDSVTHAEQKPTHKESKELGDIFGWDAGTNVHDKDQKLKKLLSDYEKQGTDAKVSESIADQGMMTGTNVSDQAWAGEGEQAVKNFVTEELYIHAKVPCRQDNVNASS